MSKAQTKSRNSRIKTVAAGDVIRQIARLAERLCLSEGWKWTDQNCEDASAILNLANDWISQSASSASARSGRNLASRSSR